MAKNTKNRPDGGKSRTPGDYEVGRGKPPVHTRFAPGVSGNPKGRPAGSSNMKTIYRDLFSREVEITENGSKRTVPMIQALAAIHAQAALRGDIRARIDLLDRAEVHLGGEASAQEDLDEADQENLERMVSRYRGATGTHGKQRSRPSRAGTRKPGGGDDHV